MQLSLFRVDRECAIADEESPHSTRNQATLAGAGSSARPDHRPALPDEETFILSALRTRSVDAFLKLAGPFLTPPERGALGACQGLPWQIAHHVLAPVVERLTRRWADMHDWPPFATVIEPAAAIGPRGPRVMTLRLERPSRGLQGTIAFQVHRHVHHVREPIPLSCLALLNELHDQGCPFSAVAYLMPMWTGRGAARTLLRSRDQCRSARARALDPLIVGWLGDGPLAHVRLPAFVPHGITRATVERRAVPHRSLVFCIGHWD